MSPHTVRLSNNPGKGAGVAVVIVKVVKGVKKIKKSAIFIFISFFQDFFLRFQYFLIKITWK